MKTLTLNKKQIKLLKEMIIASNGTIFDYDTLSTISLEENTTLTEEQYEALYDQVNYDIDLFGWESREGKLLQPILNQLQSQE